MSIAFRRRSSSLSTSRTCSFVSPFVAVPWPTTPGLPVEIAFLVAVGVPSAVLSEAAEIAGRTGVTADLALLNGGLLDEEVYYEALADHLGAPFFGNEMPVDPYASLARAIAAGIVPAASGCGVRFILAPRGPDLAPLLESRRHGASVPAYAIASPSRFAAALRQHRAAQGAAEAAADIVLDGANLSARLIPTKRQAALTIGLVPAVFALAVACPVAACLILGIPLLMWILVRLATIAAGAPPQRMGVPRRIPDAELPVYTVLVPLYREARVVAKLVRSLDRLDYPHARLDIKFLIEAEDRETRAALVALRLPARYEIVVAPDGRPRTKPRVLNVGLATARGSLLVVYDAEDEPDPDQLRAAAAWFATADPQLACLQAKLAINNLTDGWLERLFAMDYGALFDAINPGVARLGLPMLLGGTSNHFRTDVLRRVGGWDAWNVTEDADLGIRLARRGWEVRMLDRSTFEEAPKGVVAWLNQRSRWFKGWMQTFLVVTRDLPALVADLGYGRATVCVLTLATGLSSGLLGPPLMALMIVRLQSGGLFHPAGGLEVIASVTACLVFGLGLVCMVWPVVLGIVRRRRMGLLPLLALLPAYYVLMMIAAWMALVDLVRRPHRWIKTEHGLGKSFHARSRFPPARKGERPVGASRRSAAFPMRGEPSDEGRIRPR